MKTETIKAFQEALKDNPTAQEIVRSIPEPETDAERIRAYAKIAADLGYDLTEQDFAEYVEKNQQARREQTLAAIDRIQELPPEELSEAAGGGDHKDCKDTFKDYENCWVNDGCDMVYHHYHDYNCHLDFTCKNYNSSCGKTEYDRCNKTQFARGW